ERLLGDVVDGGLVQQRAAGEPAQQAALLNPFEQEFRGQGGAGGGPAGQGGEEVLLGVGRRRLGLEDVEAPPRAGRLAGRERGVEVVPDRCHAAILTVRVARSGGRSRVPLTM